MAINAQSIKELRERTQAPMGDCKSALVEADGDMDKAIEIIIKKGIVKGAKRAGAVASEGEVRASLGDVVRADERVREAALGGVHGEDGPAWRMGDQLARAATGPSPPRPSPISYTPHV